MKKLLVLVLVILVGMMVFTGCIVITAPDCCIPVTTPQSKCSVTVLALDPIIWGTVHYLILSEGKVVNTGKYLDYSDGEREMTIDNLECGSEIMIYIVDNCGGVSHKEIVVPGEDNYAYFYYWKNIDKSDDVHCRC